jgi:hypothetical protein
MPLDGSAASDMLALDQLDRVTRSIREPDLWCQQQLRSFDGRRCLLGAMMAADANVTLKAPILAAIKQVTGRDYLRIEMFNDHPLTTHGLVMRVLKQARVNLLCPTEAPKPLSFWQRLVGRLPAWA